MQEDESKTLNQTVADIKATAHDIATIARVYATQQKWVDAEHALPVYLRDDAWKKIADQGKPN